MAAVPGSERKGAANPYTSRNGYMTSFIDKADRQTFIEQHESRIATQYGRNMPEFVVVPDHLLERQGELRPWFVRSWQWVGTLEPK